jgi:hypothetical protein
MMSANFSRLDDDALDRWHHVISELWLAVEREVAKRRHALREAQEKATRGWLNPNAEELDQRDADFGDASRDRFK